MISSLIVILFWFPYIVRAETGRPARTVVCDETRTHEIRIPQGKVTVVSFPVKPKEIVPGDNVFDFKHIKNDLAVKALTSRARTNAFVYLDNRRCAFTFTTVSGAGDEIVLVRDTKENAIEVKFRD